MLLRSLLYAAAALAVWAQTERGTISGIVTDASGAVVPSAAVTITHKATNTAVTITVGDTGEYSAPNLVPGVYRVEVTAPGFKRAVLDNITLTAAGAARADLQLQVGQVSEAIEVSASAIQIQTENAKISTTVQNKMVDELPLVVGGAIRTPFNLVAIVPEARGEGQRLSLGGGQAAAWNATLDGLSVGTNRSNETAEAGLNSPSVEALTEFTIDTNGFKAEYGQASGGIMTFVSKSGTNQFHGVLYDFLRNEKLDARGFFAQSRGIYKQNDFGGTVGGPVILPRLYNGRNRTFFFFAYEGFRNRVAANDAIFSVPTPEMYQGDFTYWVDRNGRQIPIYDPATTRPNPSGSGFIRDAFPGNRIPNSRFAAFTRSVLPYAQSLKPNRGGLPGTLAYVQQNYISTGGSRTEPTDKWSVKIDQHFTSNHRLSYLYNTTSYRNQIGPSGPPGLPLPLWNGQVQAFDTLGHRVTFDWTISPTLLNHFTFGVVDFVKNSFHPSSGGNWRDKICMKNAVDCNVAFPHLTFTEFSTWGSTTYNGTNQPYVAFREDLNWIRGKHTMKFGFDFQDQRAEGFGQQNIMGKADFSFLSTGVPGRTAFDSGSSFASFLLGEAISGNTETIRVTAQRYHYYGFYAQDDWRITPKFVLNFGLRYDLTRPPFEARDQFSDFDPTRPNPAVNGYPGALRFAGFGPGRENTRRLVPGWYGGWGPRLSFAYSPDAKTTIRSGFGRSFGRVTVVQGSGHYAGFIGQYAFVSPDQGISPAFNVDAGLPSYPLPPQIDPAFANNQNVDWWQGQEATRAPENLFWTWSVQRQISNTTVIEAAYNGSVGTHLQTGLLRYNQVPTPIFNDLIARFGAQQAIDLLRADINSPQARAAGIPIPYPNFTNPAIQRARTVNQALRPFPQYLDIVTGVQNGDKSGHSSYHAFILKLERRYSRGLTLQWNYTLSKLLTDSDTYYANAPAAQDHYNRRLEKSIGAFDQTHALKLNTIYELPFGRGRKWLQTGLLSHVIGGWSIAAIQTYLSGFPVAISRNNPFPIFNGPTRPTITTYEKWRAPIQGDKFDPAVDRFLNRAAFPVQPLAFGNATRYNPKVRAFPNLNENISLAKSFQFTESIKLSFRAEAFNLLNRTVFGTGNTNLDANTFGVVANQVNDWRQMQMALKLYW